MTDNNADELIPWHYYSTKTLEDAKVLNKVTDLPDLQRRATSRRGGVTKALNRINRDKEYYDKFNLRGKQSHSRYEDTKAFLDERMGMVVNIYRRILQVIQLDKATFEKEFEEVSKAYFDGRNVIDALLDFSDPSPSKSQVQAAAAPNKGLAKATLEVLKPDRITEESLPQTFFDFNERLHTYMSANGILQISLQDQRQIARSFMSTQLWNLIRDRITANMPVFMDKDSEKYIEGEQNSLMELLELEFRRLHPVLTRRLALMKKSQRTEMSNLAFISEVKRDAVSANLRDIDEEALTCIVILNGINDQKLRIELLDLFGPQDDLKLSTIESGVRKYDANRVTANSLHVNDAQIMQLSSYKKNRNIQRREFALKNYFCDKCHQKGHTSSHCKPKPASNNCQHCGHDRESEPIDGSNQDQPNHLRQVLEPESDDEEEDQDQFTSYINMISNLSKQ